MGRCDCYSECAFVLDRKPAHALSSDGSRNRHYLKSVVNMMRLSELSAVANLGLPVAPNIACCYIRGCPDKFAESLTKTDDEASYLWSFLLAVHVAQKKCLILVSEVRM